MRNFVGVVDIPYKLFPHAPLDNHLKPSHPCRELRTNAKSSQPLDDTKSHQ
jgi:hypothetical protein